MRHLLPALIPILLLACQPRQYADLILTQAVVHTVEDAQPQAQAVAIRGSQIMAVGSNADLLRLAGPDTRIWDLGGRCVIPGFVEGHGHLMGTGQLKRSLDLSDVGSYDELIERVAGAAARTAPGTWIIGRGWHQSKWSPQPPMVLGYQTHEALSARVPDHPVFLEHASGHAAFANAHAMRLAGIDGLAAASDPSGEVLRYPDGRPTGIFTESATALISRHIPADSPESLRQDLDAALAYCRENGVTAFHDAGVSQQDIDRYQAFLREDRMTLRIHAMLSGNDSVLLQTWFARGPQVDKWLSVRAVKIYSDGALGSRGAWLIDPYTDRPDHYGNPLIDAARLERLSSQALAAGFQVCTHAIGDAANRMVLDVYEAVLRQYPAQSGDARFRIEHAQHLHPDDIGRFAALGVLPAMQAIHMASDRPWAIDRLGQARIESGAYMWQALLQSGARIVNGSDTPVEPISPLASFYASVTRQTLAGTPEGGYEPAQRMTRAQALRSYTLDATYGAFMEDFSGSIRPGKQADLVVLSQDILAVPDAQLLGTQVDATLLDGKIIYQRQP